MKKIFLILIMSLSLFSFFSIYSAQAVTVQAANKYESKIFPSCSNKAKPLNCWTKEAFDFATAVIGSMAVVAIMIGGVMYMVSGGNPDRVKLGKSIIFNALAGVAILILANWFFKVVLGVDKWGV